MTEEQIQMFMLMFPELTREQVIALGGAGGGGGGTSSVYFGEGKSTTTTTKIYGLPGGPPKAVTSPSGANTLTTAEAYLKFWTDKTTKAKVMARLKLMGRQELGEKGGYELWKDTVDQSAEIYSSGKGYKITPFELLNLSAKQSAPAPQLPQRQVQPLERATIDNFVDSIYLSTKGQLASVEEKDKLFKEFEALNTGTVTTTKKVKNPKTGVLENVSTTTRGFNQDTAQAKIEAEIKKNNPLEYQRRKAFEFSAELNKVMSGGM